MAKVVAAGQKVVKEVTTSNTVVYWAAPVAVVELLKNRAPAAELLPLLPVE